MLRPTKVRDQDLTAAPPSQARALYALQAGVNGDAHHGQHHQGGDHPVGLQLVSGIEDLPGEAAYASGSRGEFRHDRADDGQACGPNVGKVAVC